jgi:hypothetical protein
LIEAFDAEVPDREEGRETTHVEHYAIARVLHGLGTGDLEFPLEVVHQDRPDFRLILPNRRIGIELVEASSSNEIRKDALRTSETALTSHFVEPGVPGEKRKTAKALRAELQTEIQAEADGEILGDGSVGEPWPEWARGMAHFIKGKIETKHKSGFEHFPENWLVIYDNWPVIMGEPQWDSMVTALRNELASADPFSTFDRIYIISRSKLLEMKTHGYRVTAALDRRPRPGWWTRTRWFLSSLMGSTRP